MNHLTATAASPALDVHGTTTGLSRPDMRGAREEIGRSFATFASLHQAGRQRTASATIALMGRADFLHHIALNLPEVATRIDEDDFGILHLEMGTLRLATQDAIERHELHAVRRHFAFIAYLYEYANTELHDAIMISYLEALFLDGARPSCEHMRSQLPFSLCEALRRAELRNVLLRSAWSQPHVSGVPDSISQTLM